MALSTPGQRAAALAQDPVGLAVENPNPFSILGRLKALAGVGGIVASAYRDATIVALSAGQAAGTSSVMPANPARRLIAITPSVDGRLYIASAAGNGFWLPLYAGVTRILSGQDCPSNALFVTGQAAGSILPMAEV